MLYFGHSTSFSIHTFFKFQLLADPIQQQILQEILLNSTEIFRSNLPKFNRKRSNIKYKITTKIKLHSASLQQPKNETLSSLKKSETDYHNS